MRLQTGQIVEGGDQKVGDNKLRRKALLVYAGEFESMDGPVTLTDKDIAEIVEKHNSGYERLSRLFGGGAKVQVPVQLDHSTKAVDTVGRIDGPLEMGTFNDEDGKPKAAAYGNLMFIGKENIEKAEDGRWTHLSVGLDKTKKLTELSVTPFPAAPHASLLSRLGEGELDMSYSKHKHMHERYEKCKKHLTGHKGMSEEDAEKHLEAAKEEDLSRMEKEHDEEEKKMAEKSVSEEHKKDKEELSKVKAQLADVKAEQEKVRLAAAKLDVSIRLSSLQSVGKITPAELKKINVVELAGKGESVINEVLKTYESRQPTIDFKQHGTTKAIEPSKLGAEVKRLQKIKLEQETRGNMTFTGAALAKTEAAEKKRLADIGGPMPSGGRNAESMSEDIGGGMPGGPHNEDKMADKPSHGYEGMEADYETLHKMMEEGRHEEAKAHLAAMRAKHAKHMESRDAHHMAMVSDSLKDFHAAQTNLKAKLDLVTH